MNFFTKSAYSVVGVGLFWGLSASAQPSPGAEPPEALIADPSSSTESGKEAQSDRNATPPSEPTLRAAGSEVDDTSRPKIEVVEACMAHHESAQLARLGGGFVKALGELSACARPECPDALRKDCLEWRLEVGAILPTVIVVAEGDSGDLAEAQVVVDGVVLRESLDGRPIPVDPGTHVVSVTLPDGKSKVQRVVLSEGEQGRRLEFDFRSAPVVMAPMGAPPTRTIRPVPPGVYILGATAFIGLGVGVGFGSDAWSKSRTARDLCAPLCDPEVSRAVRERAAIADVALGVFVASTIGALVVYSYRPERVVPVEQVAISWEPNWGGGTLAMEGAF